jgi:hypothetical protein
MNSQQTLEMAILSYGMPTEDLAGALNEHFSGHLDPPRLYVKPNASRFRTIDPTVLVAIVGVSGTALGALISELLKLAQQKKGQQVVIQGKNGAKLGMPFSGITYLLSWAPPSKRTTQEGTS